MLLSGDVVGHAVACVHVNRRFITALLTYDESTPEEGEVLPSVVASTAFDAIPQLRIAPVFRHDGPKPL